MFANESIRLVITGVGEINAAAAVSNIGGAYGISPVSYTHLDVYKRQRPCRGVSALHGIISTVSNSLRYSHT